MDSKTDHKRVTAIVPAYNEANTIARVLEILTTFPGFMEVIVVDDGSTDSTGEIARRYKVRYLRNDINRGKGYCMDWAVQEARGGVIFFCDADVKGLTHDIVRRTLQPVLAGDVDMFIAMRNRKIYYLRLLLTVIPLLGGERALTKKLWVRVPKRYKDRFMIEAALNFYAKYYGKGFRYHVFLGLTQTIKERKYGWIRGFVGRLAMFGEIVKSQLLLQLTEVPKTVQTGRIALVSALAAIGGVVVGAAVIVAAYSGPVDFVRDVFAEELREDPDAPLVYFLLNIAALAGQRSLVAAGAILIGVNGIVLLLTAKNIRHILRRDNFTERIPVD